MTEAKQADNSDVHSNLQREVDAGLDSHYERVVADRSPAGTFWHYTSADGARNIICDKKIWFTDIRYLNDPGEMQRGIEILQGLAKIALAKAKDRVVEVFLGSFAHEFERVTYEPHAFHIASFSESLDDLPQWVAYGAQATGCAIEFSKSAFDKPTPVHIGKIGAAVFKVSYDEAQLRQDLDYLLQMATKWLGTAVQMGRGPSLQRFFIDLSSAVSIQALMLIVAHKSERYRQEKEVRALIMRRRLPETAVHVRFRTVGGLRVTPYVEYEFGDDTDAHGISQIMLGPMSHSLNDIGFEDVIEVSGIPKLLPTGANRVVRSRIAYRG
jgi:hypothetical protein